MKRKYRVELSTPAEIDVHSIHEHIATDNPQAANRWFLQVEKMIQRLAKAPFGYEVIPEGAELGVSYRHKLFGKYRIIYRVREDTVHVVRVIHGARLLDETMLHE